MRIKKGDNVKIIKGKDRGKTGKVTQAFPALGKVVIEGAGEMTKHLRTRKQGEKGQKISFNAPVAAMNVMLICPKCSKPTRVGAKMLDAEGKSKKVRVCKKCKEVIE
jgi:large subunit ribosomal protein L24